MFTESCAYKAKRALISVLLVFLVAASATPAAAQSDPTVDLKVLVISVGEPAVDPGLDMIDDLLTELEIPFDVLNSATTDLTADSLQSGSNGKYNGVIVTVADTYLPEGGAGLTPEEWTVLHDYERQFGVHESVLAGWPSTGGTPNYGMTNMTWAGNATATWTGNAATGPFAYVNQSNPMQITDFALSATPRNAEGDPTITPYLVDAANPNQYLVSHLVYPDGREVLLSTVTNAWFLDYSQTMAYAFVDFATSGLHLGARTVKLAAHIDDLFLSADRWDPAANVTVYNDPYRNTPADIATMTAGQQAYNDRFETVSNFKVDWAFNGFGTDELATEQPEPQPLATVRVLADTFIRERRSFSIYSLSSNLDIIGTADYNDERQALLQFPTPLVSSAVGKVNLNVKASVGGQETVEVCAIGEYWDPFAANWTNSSWLTRWSTGGGAGVAADTCFTTTLTNGANSIDVTPIVTGWMNGTTTNRGIVFRATTNNTVKIRSAETLDAATLTVLPAVTVTTGDALADAVIASGDTFRYLNHTYTHRDMDTTAGTTAAQSTDEITLNRQTWARLGLPLETENLPVVVTGNHSGLEDDNGTELDTSDDINYPDGINAAMITAFENLGVRYLASDTSRPNTDTEQYLPNSPIVLLPRYPTSVFYNTLDPDTLVDEYNYIFRERYLEAGQDPCTIPGAICQPRNYQEILAAEADTATRHMLNYTRFPHYFHIANTTDYDGNGSTLLFDWLNAVTAEYESRVNLPVLNLPYYEIGRLTREKLERQSADITATLNLNTGQVTFSSSAPVTLQVTGLTDGTTYGNKLITTFPVDTTGITKPRA